MFVCFNPFCERERILFGCLVGFSNNPLAFLSGLKFCKEIATDGSSEERRRCVNMGGLIAGSLRWLLGSSGLDGLRKPVSERLECMYGSSSALRCRGQRAMSSPSQILMLSVGKALP